MTIDACKHCNTTYSILQHDGQKHIYACPQCGIEFCDECNILEEIGDMVYSIHCPVCSCDRPALITITDRFSMFSSINDVTRSRHAIALLFQTRSGLARRNEFTVLTALRRMREYNATLHLLDETSHDIQDFVSAAFPTQYIRDRDSGRGAMLWVRDGVPVSFMHGGPYRVEVEIIQSSHAAWGPDGG